MHDLNDPLRDARRRGVPERPPAAMGGGARKRYSPPELVIYGSLQELTGSGKNDPPPDAFGAGSVQTG